MKTPEQIAEYYGALFMPVGLEEKCGVALHTLSLKPLNALRHPPEGGASGWYIWGGEQLSEAPDFFKPLHVKESLIKS